MSFYKETFFNRRNWILENLHALDLTHVEALCVLYIDYFNEFYPTCNLLDIAQKMKLDVSEVDELCNGLIQKGYLNLEFENRKAVYSLAGLFVVKEDMKPVENNQFHDLFKLYEQEFNRPLSQAETTKLSAWIATYEFKLILYALREAASKERVRFDYIEAILYSWKKSGFTAEDYEAG